VPGATCLARDRHNCNAAIIPTCTFDRGPSNDFAATDLIGHHLLRYSALPL